jgi:hypothetical protein
MNGIPSPRHSACVAILTSRQRGHPVRTPRRTARTRPNSVDRRRASLASGAAIVAAGALATTPPGTPLMWVGVDTRSGAPDSSDALTIHLRRIALAEARAQIVLWHPAECPGQAHAGGLLRRVKRRAPRAGRETPTGLSLGRVRRAGRIRDRARLRAEGSTISATANADGRLDFFSPNHLWRGTPAGCTRTSCGHRRRRVAPGERDEFTLHDHDAQRVNWPTIAIPAALMMTCAPHRRPGGKRARRGP